MTFIPFLPMFLPKIDAGTKTRTWRSKPYGTKGEILEAPGGRRLELLEDPAKAEAWAVAAYHYKDEGCASPEEFLKILSRIHRKPQAELLNKVGFLHSFRLVKK